MEIISPTPQRCRFLEGIVGDRRCGDCISGCEDGEIRFGEQTKMPNSSLPKNDLAQAKVVVVSGSTEAFSDPKGHGNGKRTWDYRVDRLHPNFNKNKKYFFERRYKAIGAYPL